MTYEEAVEIAKIAGTADNACSSCVGGIVNKLNSVFTEYVWVQTDETETRYFNENNKLVNEDEDWFYSETRIVVEVKNAQV